ncbi:MAG TPA: aminotransferase class V-fold PLP-dependent enzyme [Gemmatimonadales bacterium]|nr:aminotransferase class V-fold PLP-dependent enzyme [Gemmatimonadales bacterium]
MTRETTRRPPDLDPERFHALLDAAARIATRYWERLPEMRAYTRPPDELVAAWRAEPLPQGGISLERILERIEREVVPYPLGVGQRRWWGFINSPPHPAGIAAELIAATLKNNCAGTSQMAVQVEVTVMRWLADLVGLPSGSGGLLVSGGSMANLVALAAAREAKLPGTRRRGVRAAARQPTVYASTEAHSCILRAVELLGLGTDALRLVPVDREYRMDVPTLRTMLADDRAAGLEPICIVASAGTVNTGVVDPIAEVADAAQEHGCWFHVDGAYGAVGAALPELAGRYRGMERADSVAMDPHKWLYVPYEAGATLVRDPATLRAMFAHRAEYLALEEESYLEGPVWISDLGPQLTREFRALKVWAVMQAIGLEQYRALWRNDIAVAREIVRLARAHPKLEVLGPSDLSCFCVRYLPERGDANAFNRTLLDRTHRDGRMFISGTTLGGKFVLRGCVTNFRSTLADTKVCIDAIAELGGQLEKERA